MNKITKMIALVGATLFLSAGIVQADGHLAKIKERQDAMKAVGGGMKVIVGTVKGEMAFNAAAIKSAALTIKTNLEKAGTMFPDGTGEESGIKNRAKPEIWLDTEGFAAALKKTVAAADNMSKVTEMAGLLPALGQLGGGCKGCHEKFRAPKK